MQHYPIECFSSLDLFFVFCFLFFSPNVSSAQIFVCIPPFDFSLWPHAKMTAPTTTRQEYFLRFHFSLNSFSFFHFSISFLKTVAISISSSCFSYSLQTHTPKLNVESSWLRFRKICFIYSFRFNSFLLWWYAS